MRHLMIDLETMGTDIDTVVLSMGYVFFEPKKAMLGNTGHAHIKTGVTNLFGEELITEAPKQPGRTINPQTLEWWRNQSEKAKQSILDGQKKAVDFDYALARLKGDIEKESKQIIVWSNGSDFDIPILEHAFKQFDMPVPWKVWNTRCFRTLKNIAPATVAFEGVKHNALSDAEHQAKYVIASYKKWDLR